MGDSAAYLQLFRTFCSDRLYKYREGPSGAALNLIEQCRLFTVAVVFRIQGDSVGNVSIVACDNIIGHCEKNK
jgi:hypothetical protein